MTRRDALRALGLGIGLLPGALPRALMASDDALEASVRIDDEFAPLRVAIVHDASNARDVGLDEMIDGHQMAFDRGQTHPEAGPVSAAGVVRELARFRKLLADFRVRILNPESVEGAASQVFTRDPLFAVGRTAYLGSLLDEHRQPEVEGLGAICKRLPVVDLAEAEGALIEGGDVLVLRGGKLVLVGVNANTNEAGFQALASHLKRRDPEIRVVPIGHHRLHLDCCLAPLPDGSALYYRRGIARRSMATLSTLFRELIPLDHDEAGRHLAANLLWLDPKTVVSAAQAKKTNERLTARGYTVQELDFRNIKRMWGSFRCACCPLERAEAAEKRRGDLSKEDSLPPGKKVVPAHP